MGVSRIIFTGLNAGVLPSPFRGCERTHASFCCASPGRQGRAAAEGQQLSMLCNSCTLPSPGIAVLIALLTNNTRTLQGRACARVLSQQAIPTQTPRVWGVGKGKKRPWYVELSRAVPPGLRARAWLLLILLTRHFLCVSILCLFKSKRRTSPLYEK